MFIWTTINGKQTFINDEELDPCETCGERLGTCQMNNCLDDNDDFDDYGCIICGAESTNRCRCDASYEDWAAK
jgi:hypothetical protein